MFICSQFKNNLKPLYSYSIFTIKVFDCFKISIHIIHINVHHKNNEYNKHIVQRFQLLNVRVLSIHFENVHVPLNLVHSFFAYK